MVLAIWCSHICPVKQTVRDLVNSLLQRQICQKMMEREKKKRQEEGNIFLLLYKELLCDEGKMRNTWAVKGFIFFPQQPAPVSLHLNIKNTTCFPIAFSVFIQRDNRADSRSVTSSTRRSARTRVHTERSKLAGEPQISCIHKATEWRDMRSTVAASLGHAEAPIGRQWLSVAVTHTHF